MLVLRVCRAALLLDEYLQFTIIAFTITMFACNEEVPIFPLTLDRFIDHVHGIISDFISRVSQMIFANGGNLNQKAIMYHHGYTFKNTNIDSESWSVILMF